MFSIESLYQSREVITKQLNDYVDPDRTAHRMQGEPRPVTVLIYAWHKHDNKELVITIVTQTMCNSTRNKILQESKK